MPFKFMVVKTKDMLIDVVGIGMGTDWDLLDDMGDRNIRNPT